MVAPRVRRGRARAGVAHLLREQSLGGERGDVEDQPAGFGHHRAGQFLGELKRLGLLFLLFLFRQVQPGAATAQASSSTPQRLHSFVRILADRYTVRMATRVGHAPPHPAEARAWLAVGGGRGGVVHGGGGRLAASEA